jgi:hypothetical protein
MTLSLAGGWGGGIFSPGRGKENCKCSSRSSEQATFPFKQSSLDDNFDWDFLAFTSGLPDGMFSNPKLTQFG